MEAASSNIPRARSSFFRVARRSRVFLLAARRAPWAGEIRILPNWSQRRAMRVQRPVMISSAGSRLTVVTIEEARARFPGAGAGVGVVIEASAVAAGWGQMRCAWKASYRGPRETKGSLDPEALMKFRKARRWAVSFPGTAIMMPSSSASSRPPVVFSAKPVEVTVLDLDLGAEVTAVLCGKSPSIDSIEFLEDVEERPDLRFPPES